MAVPTVEGAIEYLADSASQWDVEAVTAAFNTEVQAQMNRCRIPVDLTDPLVPVYLYPADLIEAAYRRVAANLANRALPLGVQSAISEGGVGFARTGGGDREVARLEAPYRRLVVG